MEIHGYTEAGAIDATIEGVRMTVPDDLLNRHRQKIAEWEAEGNIIPAYVPPDVEPAPPHLNNGGLVRFSGAAPTIVYEAIRILGVTRIAKGRYRALHEIPMPSDQYSANPSVMDANPRIVRVTARTTSYIEVRVTDLAGVAQDPAEVTIETQRVIYP